MDLLRVVVLAWLTAIALWAVFRLLRGARQCVLFCLILHWLFSATPLWLQMCYGDPEFRDFPNIFRACGDPTTELIYLLYIAFIPIPLYLAAVSRGTTPLPWADLRAQQQMLVSPKLRPWLIAGQSLPLIAVLLSPQPELYLSYGFITGALDTVSAEVRDHHGVVALAALIALVCAGVLAGDGPSLTRNILRTLPWGLLAAYLGGKRHHLAIYITLVTWQLWTRGALRGARSLIYGVILAVVFSAYTLMYQSMVRGIGGETSDPKLVYENMRMDYGRDHTIKTAIYAELKGERIVDPRYAALEFDLLMYVPRAWMPSKPYPYGVYFTCYAVETPPKILHWVLTTTIFDEAIATFGWFGLILGPVALGLICRLADTNRNVLLRIFGLLTCVMLMAVQLSAIMPLVLVWVGGTLYERLHRNLTLSRSLTRSPHLGAS